MRQQWQEKRFLTHGAKPARRPVARAGYIDLLEGYNGAMILPDFIDQAFFDIPDDIRMVDDIWLSGHFARRGIPIWLPKRLDTAISATNSQVAPLMTAKFGELSRGDLDVAAIRHFQKTYGVWA